MWEQDVVTKFKTQYRYFSGGTEGNHENVSHANWLSTQHLKLELTKHKAEVLRTRPRGLVTLRRQNEDK